MNAQFGEYEVHVITEEHDQHEGLFQDAWLAVRHTSCESFVFDDKHEMDAWDMVSLNTLLEYVQNHICPPKED